MKVLMILVAVFAVAWSVSVRAEEKVAEGGHQHPPARKVTLEQACGSCHTGPAFVTADAEFHRVHPWQLLSTVAAGEAPRPAEMVKAAFLGVGVEKPSETLRAQLGLQEGVGLVVNFVEENSPAKGAGVRQHDVIQKLDDQWLVNEEQLVTLVRLKKAGEPVTLEVIRAGKARNVTVRLGEKDVAAAVTGIELGTFADYVDAAVLNAPTTRPVQGMDASYSVLATYAQVLDRSVSVGPITVDDGSHVIIYTPKGGGVLVAMEKGTGVILFNGPVATDEQWRDVPEKVKEKMQELHESFRRGKETTQRSESTKK
jgi:hypothetical protein